MNGRLSSRLSRLEQESGGGAWMYIAEGPQDRCEERFGKDAA